MRSTVGFNSMGGVELDHYVVEHAYRTKVEAVEDPPARKKPENWPHQP